MPIQAEIFILFSCNQWKEYSSMCLIATSTNLADIHKVIRTEIREGNMDYKGLSKRAGSKCFGTDLYNNKIDLNLLEYGYVEVSENLAYKNNRKSGNQKK